MELAQKQSKGGCVNILLIRPKCKQGRGSQTQMQTRRVKEAKSQMLQTSFKNGPFRRAELEKSLTLRLRWLNFLLTQRSAKSNFSVLLCIGV